MTGRKQKEEYILDVYGDAKFCKENKFVIDKFHKAWEGVDPENKLTAEAATEKLSDHTLDQLIQAIKTLHLDHGDTFKESKQRRTNKLIESVLNEETLSKKTWTQQALRQEYTFKKGFNYSEVELDNFSKGVFVKYIIIHKMRGAYPNFEREPKHSGFIFDDYKWYKQIGDNKYQECTNPYKK